MNVAFAPDPTHAPQGVPQRVARITGALYLAVAVLALLAAPIQQSLIVPGDAAATADKIVNSIALFGSSIVAWIGVVLADAAVAIALYLLLEPAGRALSLAAAAIRLLYAALLGALVLGLSESFQLLTHSAGAGLDAAQRQSMALWSIERFGSSFLLALVIFGVHLLVLGVLFYRSGYVPRAIGVLLVAAGAGYIVDSLAKFLIADYDGAVRAIFLAPAVIGEFGLIGWLLVKGVDVRHASDPATSVARHAAPIAGVTSATGGAK